MSWQGFTVESKNYMSYDGLSPRQKVWFWLYRFPRAWLRFQWFGLTKRAPDGWRAVREMWFSIMGAWCYWS